jgi:hypothetical protein
MADAGLPASFSPDCKVDKGLKRMKNRAKTASEFF